MTKNVEASLVPADVIMNQIYMIRDHKVMLDVDLARLYEVDNKQLKRQVRRNIDRFPADFMFELTKEEYGALRSQIGTIKRGEHSKYLPYAFTEQGVAMLSSVLNSKKAIQVNIRIMRVFTEVRRRLVENTELRIAIEEIRRKTDNNTKNIEIVFKYLDELLEKKDTQKP